MPKSGIGISPDRKIDRVAPAAEDDADATFGQAEADLINELKVGFNALVTALDNAGYMK